MKYVLTGGPCTGKTTLLEAIAKHTKYRVVPEIARGFFSHLSENEPEKLKDRDFIQKYIETQHIRNWDNNKNCFFDRGLPDEIAYRSFFNADLTPTLLQKCLRYRYDKVFLLPFWGKIYENDEVRKESIYEAELLEKSINIAYYSLGYNIVKVPIGPLDERLNFILKHI